MLQLRSSRRPFARAPRRRFRRQDAIRDLATYAIVCVSTVALLVLSNCLFDSTPLKGDANCDGHLDYQDVQIIEDHLLGRIPLDWIPCPYLADYSKDGYLSAYDAARILQDPAYEGDPSADTTLVGAVRDAPSEESP